MHILIIGGGISGLMAGTALRKNGHTITVLDKGRGIGGRLATRRIGAARFDYGAQYFTARDPQFRAYVDQWVADGIVSVWDQGFQTAAGEIKHSGEPRYRGTDDMRGIAKHLSQDLDVHTGARVTHLHWSDRWVVETDDQATFEGNALVLTPPVPQTLALLDGSQIDLPREMRKSLNRVAYHPCIAVLATLDGCSKIPDPGGLWMPGEPLSWMADNRQKGVSKAATAVTLHAGPAFSRDHWDVSDDAIADGLFDAASPWLDASVVDYQVHRWRYSLPHVLYGAPCAVTQTPGPLALAGDAFDGPRVEGAALSGLTAAKHLQTMV